MNEQLTESPAHFIEMHLWLLKARPLCSLCSNNLLFQEYRSPMRSPGPLHWSFPCFCIPPTLLLANTDQMRSHSEPVLSDPTAVLKDGGWRIREVLCASPGLYHSASAALQLVRLGRHWNLPSPPNSSAKGFSVLLAGSQLERKQRPFSLRFTPVTYQQCCLYSKAVLSLLLHHMDRKEVPHTFPVTRTGLPHWMYPHVPDVMNKNLL